MFGKETTFQVKAVQGADGTTRVKVTGSRSYGSRTASVSTEITDEKLIESIASRLDKAAASVAETLDRDAVMAAAEAMVVAGKKGETF